MASSSIHHEALIQSLTELMESGKYTDMVIKCGGRGWAVHKAVMCSASKVIAAPFDKGFKEASTGVVDCAEHEADTVQRMIHYIYKRSYDVEGEAALFDKPKPDPDAVLAVNAGDEAGDNEQPQNPDINHVLLAHIDAFAIGNHYNIPTLRAYATERFKAVSRCGIQIDGFIDFIKAISEGPSDKALQNALRNYAYQHRLALAEDEGFMDKLTAMPAAHRFTASLFQQMASQEQSEREEMEKSLKRQYKRNNRGAPG